MEKPIPEELRLHLDDTINQINIGATREEWEALIKWLDREFIPHDYYSEIHSLLKKINEQLAR